LAVKPGRRRTQAAAQQSVGDNLPFQRTRHRPRLVGARWSATRPAPLLSRRPGAAGLQAMFARQLMVSPPLPLEPGPSSSHDGAGAHPRRHITTSALAAGAAAAPGAGEHSAARQASRVGRWWSLLTPLPAPELPKPIGSAVRGPALSPLLTTRPGPPPPAAACRARSPLVGPVITATTTRPNAGPEDQGSLSRIR